MPNEDPVTEHEALARRRRTRLRALLAFVLLMSWLLLLPLVQYSMAIIPALLVGSVLIVIAMCTLTRR